MSLRGNFLNKLKEMSDEEWNNIVINPTRLENAITDNIKTLIRQSFPTQSGQLTWNQADFPESKTFADFVLIVRTKSGKTHVLAFQAKRGKKLERKKSIKENIYAEIDHRRGNKSLNNYQIYDYDKWASTSVVQGTKPDPYYLFYNANYSGINYQYLFIGRGHFNPIFRSLFNISKRINTSFMIEELKKVEKLFKNNVNSKSSIGLSDLLMSGSNTHKELVKLLEDKLK